MPSNKTKKLVLFDIDGTLVTSTHHSVSHWKERLREVFRVVYGIQVDDVDLSRVNGKLERAYFRDFVTSMGVSDSEFYEKFPRAAEHFHLLLKDTITQGKVSYKLIDGVEDVVTRIQKTSHLYMGLVTGNVEKNAWLKLDNAKFSHPFEIGAYGDSFEDRSELVAHAIEVAAKRFGHPFSVKDTVVIGDTVHDIHSAKSIGAYAVGVTTGITDTKDMLVDAGADLVVDTLVDPRVLDLLGLDQ